MSGGIIWAEKRVGWRSVDRIKSLIRLDCGYIAWKSLVISAVVIRAQSSSYIGCLFNEKGMFVKYWHLPKGLVYGIYLSINKFWYPDRLVLSSLAREDMKKDSFLLNPLFCRRSHFYITIYKNIVYSLKKVCPCKGIFSLKGWSCHEGGLKVGF